MTSGTTTQLCVPDTGRGALARGRQAFLRPPTPGRSAGPWLLFALYSLLFGCERERAITMTCEPVGDPVRVLDTPSQHQIARLGDRLLVSWCVSSNRVCTWRSQWVDAQTGASLGDVIEMGQGYLTRPDWQVVDGGLEATLMTDPMNRDPSDIPASEFFGCWRLTPDGGADRRVVSLGVPDDCPICPLFDDAYNGGGAESNFPLVEVAGRSLGLTSVLSPECMQANGGEPYDSFQRLRLYALDPPLNQEIRFEGDACQLASAAFRYEAAVPWPVPLSDGSIGVFFSAPYNGGPGPRRYVVLSPSGEVLRQPTIVGAQMQRFSTWPLGGQQGRAARVRDRLIFAEGLVNGDRCSGLRVMDEATRGLRDTPWQFSCRQEPDNDVFWVELKPYADQAAVVWSEHLHAPFVTSTSPWFEQVELALLDEQGRLASEPLRITPPEASALQPVPRTPRTGPAGRPFMTSVWVDEPTGEILVSYASVPDEHRGVFVQRVRCTAR